MFVVVGVFLLGFYFTGGNASLGRSWRSAGSARPSGPRFREPGQLHPRGERRLDLLRPPDFRGQQHILERGDYPDFQLWNAHRPQRPHGLLQARENGPAPLLLLHIERHRIELFEDRNFRGRCVDFCENCPFRQGRGFPSSRINSLRGDGDSA
ncbi:hypothetical protein Z043_112067 [Scleropages formosus]|uniref:Uncharacterized protein n=1 Tax=Scleropages formosus TaxID=113540 RepID=A0A0P7YMW5_SCLFO|nr:hypothetical protein Z043_112067 [Scleropages formosus]